MTNQEILNEIENVMNTEHYNLEVDRSGSNRVAKFYPEPFFNFNENFIRELSPVVTEVASKFDQKTGLLLIEVYKTYVDYVNEDVWKRL